MLRRLIEAHTPNDPAAEHVAGHFEHDRVDVVVSEVVVPGPLETVQGPFDVGEERVAAQPGEQPDPARLDGLRGAVEADRDVLGEYLAGRLGLAGLRAAGVPGGAGLPAVLILGELERERDVGVVVAVGVDVDPVDRAGVELRAGHRGRNRRRGAGRVRVHDQHGRARIVGRGEREDVGEVQPPVVAGELEVVGAEVVRHGCSSFWLAVRAGSGCQLRMKSSKAVLTWSAWVQGMACGPPSTTTRRTSLIRPGRRAD